MLMELAYRLVAEDSPIISQIRDNVIVSITPVADPDGRDRNVDWYYKYGIHETEGRPTGAGVPYWGKYVFHDDNRDINYSQVEMRVAARLVFPVSPADHARPASGADRCCTRSAARRPTTPISIRSCTASCR